VSDERARVITLIALFRETARLMVDELVERLHAAGYGDQTAAHHPVFENIDPEGTRLTVLAARAGMTHQSMGELVQTLERRGYLERRPDPSDGRATLVLLTRPGRQSARRAIEEIAEIEAAWLERFRRAGLDVDLRALLEAALREREAERKARIG
jgi:DNA-binding MarR family transcriptional regulator